MLATIGGAARHAVTARHHEDTGIDESFVADCGRTEWSARAAAPGATVSAIANALGYINLGEFARSYRDRFGA